MDPSYAIYLNNMIAQHQSDIDAAQALYQDLQRQATIFTNEMSALSTAQADSMAKIATINKMIAAFNIK